MPGPPPVVLLMMISGQTDNSAGQVLAEQRWIAGVGTDCRFRLGQHAVIVACQGIKSGSRYQSLALQVARNDRPAFKLPLHRRAAPFNRPLTMISSNWSSKYILAGVKV